MNANDMCGEAIPARRRQAASYGVTSSNSEQSTLASPHLTPSQRFERDYARRSPPTRSVSEPLLKHGQPHPARVGDQVAKMLWDIIVSVGQWAARLVACVGRIGERIEDWEDRVEVRRQRFQDYVEDCEAWLVEGVMQWWAGERPDTEVAAGWCELCSGETAEIVARDRQYLKGNSRHG
ncbi:hypothetical protein P153DRAFT_412598 [Dothidotthia symphoricarpi CBS 119687]|uniref:Uncharacterized protein n=1 Tax=Dothidotthia symphoricarpi CBS 119687 TaxID=1392245 RepID=A0A6A5ZZ67_9PLEO|nr:uncharacterized protein P153DRAFT_412598 [Dothidotthia symphoricarpi CBS 119687]KAF2123708.1 hypothetical protein P153DRAFT_412598 [Dothidotthia symphoricarpi CBS 119687]